jgi:hypothetical protein
LLFIDPDDYVDSECFGRALDDADKQRVQVSFLGFTFLNEDGSICKRLLYGHYTSENFSGIDAYYISRSDGRTDPDRMCAVLFDSEFINSNNLHYLPDVPFLEDGELIARILCLAERCIFYGHSFYQRTTRPGSATNSRLFKSEKASQGFLSAAKSLRRFQKEQTLTSEQILFLNQPICKFVLLTFRSSLQPPFLKNYKRIREKLTNCSFKRLELQGVVRPYIYYAYLYNYLKISFLASAFLVEFGRVIKAFLKSTGIISNNY